ncbi:MAG: mechanosensitive ion channel family protein [Hyphomicrobiaceae bacterium]
MKLAELLAAAAGGVPGDWQKLLDELTSTFGTQLANLNSRWTLYQAIIIVAAFFIAKSAAKYLEPQLESRLRQIKGQPGLLRILVILLRRIDLMLLALILAIAGTIILRSTWPSNAYMVRLAAHLALALAVVSTISRLIRNRLLQVVFSVVGWTIAALSVLGWLEPTVNLLDDTSITLGASRLSLLLMLKSGILLVVFVWLATVVGDFLERRIGNGLELTPAMQVLAGKLIRWGLIGIAVVTALGAVGVDLTAFTVLSGAIGIGVGFGLQKLASNLISGVIILTDRSIKPGDTITIGDMRGTISSLHARYVSVLTLTGAELLVPNERFVTETVVNWSYSNRRMLVEIPFGVDYGSDPNEVRDIAIRVARGVERVLAAPQPRCQLRAFGDSSLDMALLFWIDDPENGLGNVKSEILFGLWAAFKEAGVEIPFPHREIIIKQPQMSLPNGNPTG